MPFTPLQPYYSPWPFLMYAGDVRTISSREIRSQVHTVFLLKSFTKIEAAYRKFGRDRTV